MIGPEDLGSGIKGALEASGADAVSLVESDLEVPRLEVVIKVGEGPLIMEVSFGDVDPAVLQLEAGVLRGLSADGESGSRGSLEFALRVLNELNRLEGTPWKFWLSGPGVGFEGAMSGEPEGEVWATWNVPAELLSVDDVPDLCWRFWEALGKLDLAGLV